MYRLSSILACAIAASLLLAPGTVAAQEKAGKPKSAPAVTTPINLNTATAAALKRCPVSARPPPS